MAHEAEARRIEELEVDAARMAEREAELQVERWELEQQRALLREGSAALGAYMARNEALVLDEAATPEEVEVFYATTRARTGPSEPAAGPGTGGGGRREGEGERELDLRPLLAPLSACCLLLRAAACLQTSAQAPVSARVNSGGARAVRAWS